MILSKNDLENKPILLEQHSATATISKAFIKFWSKFHIQILWYNLTRDNSFLLTPSQSLSGKQEKSSPSTSRHPNNSLSVYLFSILNCS